MDLGTHNGFLLLYMQVSGFPAIDAFCAAFAVFLPGMIWNEWIPAYFTNLHAIGHLVRFILITSDCVPYQIIQIPVGGKNSFQKPVAVNGNNIKEAVESVERVRRLFHPYHSRTTTATTYMVDRSAMVCFSK